MLLYLFPLSELLIFWMNAFSKIQLLTFKILFLTACFRKYLSPSSFLLCAVSFLEWIVKELMLWSLFPRAISTAFCLYITVVSLMSCCTKQDYSFSICGLNTHRDFTFLLRCSTKPWKLFFSPSELVNPVFSVKLFG